MEETPGKVVGRRLYITRRALGLTQEEVSRRTGLRQGVISHIERGKSDNIETQTLIALAKGLGVSIDYLVGLTGQDTDTTLPPPLRRGPRPAKVGV